jgi:hypothetical protein
MRAWPSRTVLAVSKGSRFAFARVSQAPRLAFFFFAQAPKPTYSPDYQSRRLPDDAEAKRDALLTRVSRLVGFFVVGASHVLTAFAGSASLAPNLSAPRPSPPNAYVTVKHLGESEQQATAREGQLLSLRRATDPFGNIVRGPFKGLPPVVEHSTPTPGPSTAASQVAAAANLPTLEKAVQELTIGAVDVSAHEILIGSRSMREGDLLVLESSGHQFVVWVQNVGVRGVLFCDIDMQKHILKAFGSGPKELPAHSDSGISDIQVFLKKDAHP